MTNQNDPDLAARQRSSLISIFPCRKIWSRDSSSCIRRSIHEIHGYVITIDRCHPYHLLKPFIFKIILVFKVRIEYVDIV